MLSVSVFFVYLYFSSIDVDLPNDENSSDEDDDNRYIVLCSTL